MSNSLAADPLTQFVSEENKTNKKLSTTTMLQKYAETMSRIGASASDMFAESLSFGDPLSRSSQNIGVRSPAQKNAQQSSYHKSENEYASATPAAVKRTSSIVTASRKLTGIRKDMHTNNDIVENLNAGEVIASSSSSTMKKHVEDNSNDHDFRYLSGEIKFMSLNGSRIQIAPGKIISGTLVMTSYRIVFVPVAVQLASKAAANPSIYSFLNLPLGSIDRIEKEKRPKDSRINTSLTFLISCKDLRQLRITLQCDAVGMGENEVEKAVQQLAAAAFPNDRSQLFAFLHSSTGALLPLAEPYEPIKEFSRLGILDVLSATGDDMLWRFTNINSDYRMCNTYPKMLVVPGRISDEELSLASNFRSGHRLPVMCWGDKDSGATMWRSSQPKAGVSGSCMQDEKLLDAIAQSCVYRRTPTGVLKMTGDPLLCIIDCRPKVSIY